MKSLRVVSVLIVLLTAMPSLGQDRPSPAAEFAAGAFVFADDGIATEGFVGGSGRFYLLPRLSFGPELAYINGNNHSHVMITGNVTYDLIGQRTVTPFIVAGAGVFRTKETFFNTQDFTSTEGAFTAGGGARVPIGRNMYIGVDARVGWELHLRVNGFVGVRFGG